MHELPYPTLPPYNRSVTNHHMACKTHRIRKYNTITNTAVVTDVDTGHDQTVVSDHGHSFALTLHSAAVNGRIFSDDAIFANSTMQHDIKQTVGTQSHTLMLRNHPA
jgi:hypothetical protein